MNTVFTQFPRAHFRRSAMRTVAIFAFAIACVHAAGAQPVRFQMHEMLGRPSDHSVTLNMMADVDLDVYAEYGIVSGTYTNRTEAHIYAANIPIEFVIDSLSPNTAYVYRMRYRRPGSGVYDSLGEHHFHTQRTRSSTFSFTVQADPHLDEQSDTLVYRACLANQLASRPDFMIDLGDIFMSDKLTKPIIRDSVDYRHRYQRTFYDGICGSVPLFIALGNHEGEAMFLARSDSNNVAIWGTKLRKLYYPNPSPDGFYTGDTTEHAFVGQRENYYAFEWGDALFVVIDPYWYTTTKPNSDLNSNWNWTLGRTQYDWLRRTLRESTAKFKFVFTHQLVGGVAEGRGGAEAAPFFEWGGLNADTTEGFVTRRPGWQAPIHRLLVESQVNIVFHGHDHFFARQELDGVIYQLVPQPSHPQFKNASNDSVYGYHQGIIIPNSGHLLVTVSGNETRVDYVRAYKGADEGAGRRNGDISATYTISATSASVGNGPLLWDRGYEDEILFPNPFTIQAILRFKLLQPGNYALNIYDARGMRVRTLLERRRMEPGEFSTVWDGRDDAGNDLPSGVYLYALECDGRISVSHRAVLAR